MWFWSVIIAFIVLYGGYRTWESLRSYGYRSTTGKITKSEPVCLETDDTGLVGTYYPAINYSYKIQEQTYNARKHRFPEWKLSVDYDKVSALCDQYRVGSEITVWYDQHYPSQSVIERKPDRLGILFLIFGLSSLLLLGIRYSLGLPQLGLILLSAAVVLMVIASIEDILKDSIEITKFDDPSFVACTLETLRGVDRGYIQACGLKLEELGFTKVGEFSSAVYTRYGHKNFIMIFISPDRKTMASVGHIWYARKFLGLIPLSFLGLKSTDFDAHFSNGLVLTTTQNPSHTPHRPRDCRLLKVPQELTIKEIYQRHCEEIERILSEDRLVPEHFSSQSDCLDFIRATLRRILSYVPPELEVE